MYIVIEGVDCAGKTTQAKFLEERLSIEHKVKLIHQPGTTPIGLKIREIVKDKTIYLHDNFTLDLLFQADNIELGAYLEDQLDKSNTIYISDRCNLVSSYSYGLARGCPYTTYEDMIYQDTRKYPSLIPDVVFILDIGLEEYHERVIKREVEKDRIESLGDEYLQQVIDNYKQFKQFCPVKTDIHIIDGRMTPAIVFDQMTRILGVQ